LVLILIMVRLLLDFLAYKLALLTVLYEEVVRMMITESEPEKDRISHLDSFDSALESEK